MQIEKHREELDSALYLAEHAEPDGKQDAGLSAKEVDGRLRTAIYRRYRAVYEKLQQAERGHLLTEGESREFHERLRDAFVAERSAIEWERIVGPTRPTRAQMEAQIEQFAAEGVTVLEIGHKENYEIRDGKITGSFTVTAPVSQGDETGTGSQHLVLHEGEPFEALADPETGLVYWVEKAKMKSVNGERTGTVSLIRGEERRTIPIVEGTPYFRFNGIEIKRVRDFVYHDDGTFSVNLDTDEENWVVVVHGKPLKELAGISILGDDRSHIPVSSWVHEDRQISAALMPATLAAERESVVFRGENFKKFGDRIISRVDHFLVEGDHFVGVFRDPENKPFLVVDGALYTPFEHRDELEYADTDSIRLKEGRLSGFFRYHYRGDSLIVDGIPYRDRLRRLPELRDVRPEDLVIKDVMWSESGLPNARIIHRKLGSDPEVWLLVEGELRDQVAGIPVDQIEEIIEWHIYDGAINGKFKLVTQDNDEQTVYVIFDKVVLRDHQEE